MIFAQFAGQSAILGREYPQRAAKASEGRIDAISSPVTRSDALQVV